MQNSFNALAIIFSLNALSGKPEQFGCGKNIIFLFKYFSDPYFAQVFSIFVSQYSVLTILLFYSIKQSNTSRTRRFLLLHLILKAMQD